jgi:hypothetical protein
MRGARLWSALGALIVGLLAVNHHLRAGISHPSKSSDVLVSENVFVNKPSYKPNKFATISHGGKLFIINFRSDGPIWVPMLTRFHHMFNEILYGEPVQQNRWLLTANKRSTKTLQDCRGLPIINKPECAKRRRDFLPGPLDLWGRNKHMRPLQFWDCCRSGYGGGRSLFRFLKSSPNEKNARSGQQHAY